jgi:hypothetical protein
MNRHERARRFQPTREERTRGRRGSKVTSRRSTLAAAGLAVMLAASAAWYLNVGRAFIIDDYGHSEHWLFKNLLAGEAAVSLSDFLDVADHLAWTIGIAVGALALVLFAWRFVDGLMAGLYSAMLRACDLCLSKRRLTLVLGGAASVAALAAIGVIVLQDFPNSGDEYCYLYEAETFAQGRTWNAAHPLQEFFETTWVRQIDGRVFSIFPPGWPAVLASARAAHVPLWLVNPVLGCLSLVLLFILGRRLYDERTALVAVTATFASSFFLFNGGSYFSHTFCSVQVLALAYFGTRAMDERRAGFAALAGAVAGAALLTRNYTMLWCGLPFALALLGKGRFGWKSLLVAAAGGVPFVLIYLAYNASTTGHPFVTGLSGTFGQFDQQFFPNGWIGRALENLGGRVAAMTAWTPPALIGLYFWWWRETPRREWRFVDFIFPCLAVGYFVYMDRGGNRYGPRFYYEGFPLLVLAAVSTVVRESMFAEKRLAGRFAFYLFAVSMAACVPLFAWHAGVESRVIWERQEPYRLATQQQLERAVVFVSTKSGATRPMAIRDLTRNGVEPTGQVLFVRDLGPENARLMRYYPDRSFYRYRFDRDFRSGTLEPVVNVPGR